MAAKQQQVAALFQSVLSRGVETKDALPTVKALVEAKIFSLDNLNASNVPSSINKKIQKKLLNISKPKRKRLKTNPIVVPPIKDTPSSILINRSPVLTLWATIVAQSLFSLELSEALSVASAVAASIAKAKGTSLGIYEKKEENDSNDNDEKSTTTSDTNDSREFHILGVVISAHRTEHGIRAASVLDGQQEQDPHKTWELLQRRFGDALGFVFQKMSEAANEAPDLDASAYGYYMHIRPDIPQGTKGWGAHGHLYTSKLSDYYPTTKKQACKEE